MVAVVPDDDRTRRRLGDDTKGRIADLASGWSMDKESGTAAPEVPPAAAAPRRQKQKTVPPPPPGSAERLALEAAIIDGETPIPIANPRTKPPSAPPPKTVGSKSGQVPAIPPPKALTIKSGPTETGSVVRSGVIGATGPIPLSVPPAGYEPSGPHRSGAIPISDRSAAIVHSAPISSAKSAPISSGLVARPSGSAPTKPPPIPPKITSELPLRGDATDIAPPPRPPPPPRRAALVSDLDDSAATVVEAEPGAMPKLTVPLGEFDEGGGAGTTVEQDKLRIAYEQSTLKRDAASALLGIAEAPETKVKAPPVEMLLDETAHQLIRGDATDAPATTRFERGDPTLGSADPTIAQFSTHMGGTLRSGATLRRKRGLGGDLRYVITVLMGVRRARHELEALDQRQALREQSRRRHLITLGRTAASLDGLDHPGLGPAREKLAIIEDERSKHAGAVTAADGELTRVRRDRESKLKEHADERVALEAELVEIDKKLEPLEKECTAVSKRAAELRDSLRRIDAQIAATEASQHSVKKGKEVSEIHAEIATLKADRIAVKRDEPKLAAELDALNPRIAQLEARRVDARKRRTEIDQAEVEDQRRVEELLAAIGAKRKVVDRAAGDAETIRDKILFDLGERLYVDRPPDVASQLSPIDVIDVELGTGERRSMELREILSSVDKAKLARGIALAVLGLATIGGIVALFLYIA